MQDMLITEFPIALDLGCFHGNMFKYLKESRANIQKLYQMDVSEQILQTIENENDSTIQIERMVGDEEVTKLCRNIQIFPRISLSKKNLLIW